jgi:pyroglutamyl-peptidase
MEPDYEETKPSKPISFIVTGFGPFQGVSSNPTESIVRELVEYLESAAPPSQQYLANITRTLLLETSAQAVNEKLDQLHQELIISETAPQCVTVMLHLGVNYNGTTFQLERCAFNNANFRAPDEQNYMPQNKCIMENQELEACLTSRFDIPELVHAMNATPTSTKPCTKAIESMDIGRFVCNYAYFYSLDKFQSHKQCPSGSFRSLFLHVPPQSVASEAEQLDFVARLMDTIYIQLTEAALALKF